MAESGNDVRVRRLGGTDPLELRECPICAHPTATPRYEIDRHPFVIVVCDSCGAGRFDPHPTTEDIATFYPATYYGSAGEGRKFTPAIEGLVRATASRKARRFSRGLPEGARVLDVGCGRGTLLRDLADLGFEVHGVEVSEEATRGADERAEIRIAWTLAEAGYPAESFDLVILWHVLEHLSAPLETLREIHRALQPGGRLSLAVPNFSSLQARWAGEAWFHLDPPRHLFHFSMPALLKALDDCGFEVVSVSHFSLRQNPFGWVQSLLNRSESMSRNALYSILENDARVKVSSAQRAACLAAFVLGMPVALLLSALTALFRSGATVGIEARRRT
jgi:SAM-dependent methyltransferase